MACWFSRCLLMVALLGTVGGCTPLRDWVRKGFKVGPDYCPPPVASEDDWIDAGSPLLSADPVDEGAWWTLLGDPVLNDLTAQVRQNNWTLRELGARILASRAQYDFTKGRLFPQSQSIDGTYTRRVFGFDQGPLPPEFLSLLG